MPELRPTLTYECRVSLTDMPCSIAACPGVMEFDKRSRNLQPQPRTEYRHRCLHCGNYEWLPVQYPIIEYIRPQEFADMKEFEDETEAPEE